VKPESGNDAKPETGNRKPEIGKRRKERIDIRER
jgi:hypothetical protein